MNGRILILTAIAAGLAAGCEYSSRKRPTMREKSDAMLKDPFGYQPEMLDPQNSSDPRDLNARDGIRRDLDMLLNP